MSGPSDFQRGAVSVSPPIGARLGWAGMYVREFFTADEAHEHARHIKQTLTAKPTFSGARHAPPITADDLDGLGKDV